MNCKDCTEYASEFCKQCLEEEMTVAADAGIPQDTATMGPKYKTYRVLDKRRKKEDRPRVLKRFKEIRK